MDSKKYRKKPVVIEAVEYERDKNIASCMDFCPDMVYNSKDNEYDIITLEGLMRVTKGDFIIKGINGEFYPCKPDIFRKTYEEVAISKMETTSWMMIDSDINLWKCSKCGEEWTFEYGGPDENNMHYCPHCGRKLNCTE
jgi:Pyruvate/2-oxoacid:ferredoxin oxidoreductase delta subunit